MIRPDKNVDVSFRRSTKPANGIACNAVSSCINGFLMR